MTAQQYEASLSILSELNANVPLAPRFHEPKVVLGAGN
jgi:hypothetical protein